MYPFSGRGPGAECGRHRGLFEAAGLRPGGGASAPHFLCKAPEPCPLAIGGYHFLKLLCRAPLAAPPATAPVARGTGVLPRPAAGPGPPPGAATTLGDCTTCGQQRSIFGHHPFCRSESVSWRSSEFAAAQSSAALRYSEEMGGRILQILI